MKVYLTHDDYVKKSSVEDPSNAQECYERFLVFVGDIVHTAVKAHQKLHGHDIDDFRWPVEVVSYSTRHGGRSQGLSISEIRLQKPEQ